MQFQDLQAKKILDSSDSWTIESTLKCNNEFFIASVPFGTSSGKFEAKQFPAEKAISIVNKKIKPIFLKKDFSTQSQVDSFLLKLDSTKNKSRLGANSILSVSIAACKAFSFEKKLELFEFISKISKQKISLPVPSFNVINAGKHSNSKIAFQEFHLMPLKAKSFSQALDFGLLAFNELKNLIEKKQFSSGTGLEGGFSLPFNDSKKALSLLQEVLDKTGLSKKVFIGIDCASNSFCKKGFYFVDSTKLNSSQLLDYYLKLKKDFSLIYIEDPFNETDFISFSKLNYLIGKNTLIMGDDLTCSNKLLIQKAVKSKSVNSIILKPNQIGSVSETIESCLLAKKNNLKVMVSHRSNETNDTFISDLAVGLGAELIKSGAPNRGERIAKYNRLLEIESLLGRKAIYSGKKLSYLK